MKSRKKQPDAAARRRLEQLGPAELSRVRGGDDRSLIEIKNNFSHSDGYQYA